MLGKARDYDQLIETLERIGLVPDMLGSEEIISISDRELAAEWFRNAHSWGDDE
ncbi:MAG TPA: hypothetical protein VFE60_19955 [Roseiarcus sp.]|jgi:hypothetical protein|nr:hypothetical protein [Roseiarcus sp.]